MLSTVEKNELLRRLEKLNDAWEIYVAATKNNLRSRYSAGAEVVNLKEELINYIKKELS